MDPVAIEMIEDLQQQVGLLLERIRQLEAERDQWQRQAVNND